MVKRVGRALEYVMLLRGTMLWRDWYRLYLKTPYWRFIRRKVLMRDGYRCVKCGSKANIQVDHIKYSFGNERLEDLQTLCYYCHHNKSQFDIKAANPHYGTKVVKMEDDAQLFSLLRR